jgi:mono/diheme cytochrome c family protein
MRSQAASAYRKAALGWTAAVLLAGQAMAQEEASVPAPEPHLPPGPEVVLIEQHCVACHGISRIAKGGGTVAGWTDRLGRMIRFGSTLPRSDITALAVYLAKVFPPRPRETAAPSDTADMGVAIHKPVRHRRASHRAGAS